MRNRAWLSILFVVAAGCVRLRGARPKARTPKFQTSDRCLACHNGLTTDSGKDVSIGFDWRSSIMANSSRDPYWQGSVRRETIDHPSAKPHIEDECSVCHMPITRYEAKLQGEEGEIFAHLPFDKDKKNNAEAEDGVSCSVCHQIGKEKLGTRRELQWRVRRRSAGVEGRPPRIRTLCDSERASAHHAKFLGRISPDGSCAYSRLGFVRHLPHAVQPRLDQRRKTASDLSRSRCRIRSGCTAIIAKAGLANPATCPKSESPRPSPPCWA